MAEETQLTQVGSEVDVQEKESGSDSTFTRVAKYTGARLVMLFLTVVIGVYITVLIANMGGYVDVMRRGMIQEEVGNLLRADEEYILSSPEEKEERYALEVERREAIYGLDQPFIVRSFRYLGNAITLDLGRSQGIRSDSGTNLLHLTQRESGWRSRGRCPQTTESRQETQYLPGDTAVGHSLTWPQWITAISNLLRQETRSLPC